MIEKLLSYQPFAKSLLAIEHSQKEDATVIYGIALAQKKGELDIIQTFTGEHVDEISEYIKTAAQANLVITDEYILSKEVTNVGADAEILAEAFPNLNLNDFYYQILRTANRSFIAVCRKQHVETLIETYQKAAITITSVCLGGLKMAALSSFADADKRYSHNTEVSYKDGEVITIGIHNATSKEHYDIEGLTFTSSYTLPLAVVLDAVLGTETITGNIDSRNSELHQHYRESRFFKNTLQFGIGFLLLALLVNFFVFNTKYKKWQGLQEELQVYTAQQEQIKSKQSDVNTKEALVQSILTTGFSKSSYSIDQMIQALPNTVLLTTYTYQPLEKPIRKGKAIDFKTGVIAITGKSTDKKQFTNWLRAMERLSFVETVTITQYGLDKKNTSDFELTIGITSDGAAN